MTLAARLFELSTTAQSPDRNITATAGTTDGLKVAMRPGTMQQHDQTSLVEQVQRAVDAAATGYRSACRAAMARAYADDPASRPGSERLREYTAQVRRIEAVGTSASGCVTARRFDDARVMLRMRDRTVLRFGQKGLINEINSALSAANAEHARRAGDLFHRMFPHGRVTA